MYLFPQDTLISSQSWHILATLHPQPDQGFVSIVRDLPLPGSAACIPLFHFLHCSLGRVSSHLCHPLGFRTLLCLSPGLRCTNPSFHRSFILTPGNSCPWWRYTQQPNLEFSVLFCSQGVTPTIRLCCLLQLLYLWFLLTFWPTTTSNDASCVWVYIPPIGMG